MSENMREISERLSSLDPASLAEVAEAVVADIIGINEPASAAVRVAELVRLAPLEAGEIQKLAEQASEESLCEFSPVMQTVLLDVIDNDLKRRDLIARAVGSTGRKQVVTGPEVYTFCFLLISGYIGFITRGKKETTDQVSLQVAPDGRIELTVRKHTVYLNPFGPLAALLRRILGGDEIS